MDSRQLIQKYFDFFKNKGHAVIPSAPLVPENDPSVLFTTAGMHPLVPFLLGESHPSGKRLVDVQLILRTDDIDEVGDTSHHTFFEMLGNWGLGDYWKEESLSWSYEFLVKELSLDPDKIWVTCFAGDLDAAKDTEAEIVWKKLGIPLKRIFFYGKKDNWWGPAGVTGPCGPDSEIFYDTTGKPHGVDCKPGDNCGRFFEIWNNVFMQYNKTGEGKFEQLLQKNVDTGMGVERTTAVIQGLSDDYLVRDVWEKVINKTEEVLGKSYFGNEKAIRIIADHVRASVFVISEGIIPGNKGQGYILRRLIRRAFRYGMMFGVKKPFLSKISNSVIEVFKDSYPRLGKTSDQIMDILEEEEKRFLLTVFKGIKEVEKFETLDGKKAFFLYESYGFPLELTEEIAKDRGQKIDKKIFEKEFEKHKNLSRTTSSGMFKGGLADQSEEVTKFHTATHLLHASLRKVLGDQVAQKGSNITSERLRFDFSNPEKLTEEEIKKIEDLVNEQIKRNLPVSYKVKSYKEALEERALAFFGEKYGEKVKVYTVGPSTGSRSASSGQAGSPFSREICGGPHVASTGEIGGFRIIKQEKIGAGIVRIYATNRK